VGSSERSCRVGLRESEESDGALRLVTRRIKVVSRTVGSLLAILIEAVGRYSTVASSCEAIELVLSLM